MSCARAYEKRRASACVSNDVTSDAFVRNDDAVAYLELLALPRLLLLGEAAHGLLLRPRRGLLLRRPRRLLLLGGRRLLRGPLRLLRLQRRRALGRLRLGLHLELVLLLLPLGLLLGALQRGLLLLEFELQLEPRDLVEALALLLGQLRLQRLDVGHLGLHAVGLLGHFLGVLGRGLLLRPGLLLHLAHDGPLLPPRGRARLALLADHVRVRRVPCNKGRKGAIAQKEVSLSLFEHPAIA